MLNKVLARAERRQMRLCLRLVCSTAATIPRRSRPGSWQLQFDSWTRVRCPSRCTQFTRANVLTIDPGGRARDPARGLGSLGPQSPETRLPRGTKRPKGQFWADCGPVIGCAALPCLTSQPCAVADLPGLALANKSTRVRYQLPQSCARGTLLVRDLVSAGPCWS